jgi:hypothetical protein
MPKGLGQKGDFPKFHDIQAFFDDQIAQKMPSAINQSKHSLNFTA